MPYCYVGHDVEATSVSVATSSAWDGADNGLILLLDEAAACARRLQDLNATAALRLTELKNRLMQGRLHLAVLGQFKRGKSTFLNALLGDALLPTAVVPLTAIPTLIEGGGSIHVRILFHNGQAPRTLEAATISEAAKFLEQYVTETGNPKNALGVARVEVQHPAKLLAHGVVLIDTPGIGSTLDHNTEATMNFLPQCDAALFLISADPPMTDTEADFLDLVRTKVPRIFFVLNKIDYLSATDQRAAMEFFRNILTQKLGITDVRIFPVSSKLGFQAKISGDEQGWQDSGMRDVEELLIEFLSREKQIVLHEAVGSKTADVVGALRMEVNLAIRACELPKAELERRMALLERRVNEARQQRVAAQDVLAGDRRRTIEFVESLAEEIRANAARFLQSVADNALATAAHGTEQQTASAALAQVVPSYFRNECERFAQAALARLTKVLRPHQQQIESLVETVRSHAAEIFDIPSYHKHLEEKVELPLEHYWSTEEPVSSLPLLPASLMDRFFPTRVRRDRVRRRLAQGIESIVNINVEQIRWSVLQKLADAFRSFSSNLDQRLETTVQGIHDALEAAATKRTEAASSVAARLQELKASDEQLASLEKRLAVIIGDSH